MDLKTQIEVFEGRRHAAYPDPISKGGDPWTIGIGHTGPDVHKGLWWTDQQIDAAYDRDSSLAIAQCANRFPWFAALNPPRQAVLINMVFQMGIGGVRGFPKMLAAVQAKQYSVAATQMLNSDWHRQTKARCECLANQMRTGVWQPLPY